MALLSMMKILASPECPQSSAGAMGNAEAQTGEPDVQVSLAPQDAQGTPGSGGRQEQGWVAGHAAQPLGACCSPRPAPGKAGEPGHSPMSTQFLHPLPAAGVRGLYPHHWAGAGTAKPC